MTILGWSGLAIGAEGVTIAFWPSLSLSISAMFVAIGVGLAAGVIPAAHASRTNVVTALREG